MHFWDIKTPIKEAKTIHFTIVVFLYKLKTPKSQLILNFHAPKPSIHV